MQSFVGPIALNGLDQSSAGICFERLLVITAHLDLKPMNVLVALVNRTPTAKLADFGLSRAGQRTTGGGNGMLNDRVGTVEYMAVSTQAIYRCL